MADPRNTYLLREGELGTVRIADELIAVIAALFSAPVMMMKRSKSGEKETDITSFLSDVTASDAGGALTLRFLANAADSRYLNPVYVARAIAEKLGFDAPYAIKRKRLLLADKSELV